MRFVLHVIALLAIGLILFSDLLLSLLLPLKRVSFSLLSSLHVQMGKIHSVLATKTKQLRQIPSFLTFITRKPSKKKKRSVSTPSFSLPSINLGTKTRYFLIGSFCVVLFGVIPLIALLFLQDLPHPRELTSRQIPQTTKIYDRHGELLYEIYASQNRTLVPLRNIPPHLQHATLAIEDKNFYHHWGFDIQGIIRALKENSSGEIVQGGSTITQQLIKSSMLTPERTIERKVREIVLAFWAERIYSKEQILEMYFNQVPYGGTAWGVEAAAEVYFKKNVRELTLAESAFLAGITAAPTAYSPYGANPTLWKNRQTEVLSRMSELGYITPDEAKAAQQEELTFAQPYTAFHAPHFVTYIKNLLIQKYGLAMVEKGGLQVITSLDLNLQEQAEQIVAEEVAHAAYLNLSNGAALVTDPNNGDILAMVGSRDYYAEVSGNVNITTSLRQPGSTVKVITYAAALQKGYTAASTLQDSPVTFVNAGSPPYKPVNYDGTYRGRVTLRTALANSLNIPAVKLLNQVGVPTMVELGRDMGITSWDEDIANYGLAVTLGGSEATMLDMATVNGTLANEGKRVNLNPLLKITTAKGEVLEQKTISKGVRVLDSGVAFIISDILADNNARSLAFGPSSPLTIPGHRVSVKTGTSDNKRDNWTIGYTDDFVVTVWVGNNDNTPMSQTLASGISGAAPIWHRITTEMIKQRPSQEMKMPPTVVQLPCFGRNEYFLKESMNGECRFSYSNRGFINDEL